MLFWRCQTHLMDSPQEFVLEAISKEYLEERDYNVCGGPYKDLEEAEFWMYGGPHCNIQLLNLTQDAKEIEWLLKNPSFLSEKELEWLNNLSQDLTAPMMRG